MGWPCAPVRAAALQGLPALPAGGEADHVAVLGIRHGVELLVGEMQEAHHEAPDGEAVAHNQDVLILLPIPIVFPILIYIPTLIPILISIPSLISLLFPMLFPIMIRIRHPI